MGSQTVPNQSVHADIEYTKRAAGATVNNPQQAADVQNCFIKDIRGNEDKYTLEKNGFQYADHAVDFSDYDNAEAVRASYFPQCRDFIIKHLGARDAYYVNHQIRNTNAGKTFAPAARPHVDRTPMSTRQNYDSVVDEETRAAHPDAKLLHMSLWRPITTVYRNPLGVIDETSSAVTDLIKIPRPFHITGEGDMFVGRYNPTHEWCYKSEQRNDEILLIKLSDERSERPQGTLHTSFRLPDEEGKPARESIETRIIAVF